MKRPLALLVCAVMLAAMLAGCNQQTPQAATTAPEQTTAASAAPSGSAPAATEPAKKDEITIDAFIMSGVSSISGVWSDWCSKKLVEDLNMHINFWPTGSDVQTKMRSYIAADNMPDLLNFNDKDIAQEAVDAGMLLKLNQYDKLMPEIFSSDMYTQAIRYYKKYISDGTGENIYVVPAGVGKPAFNSFNWVPEMQWAAYRDAGKPKLATFEDYLTAFEAMLKVKPTNDKGEKVYALSLQKGAYSIDTMAYFYGIAILGNLMEADVTARTIKPMTAEDSFFKRGLHFVYEANQKGMLDPDSLTQSFDDITGKISAGRVLFSYYSWWTGTYNNESSGYVNNEKSPDGLVPIVADDFKLYEIPESTVGYNRHFAISAKSKNIERTCELLNWLYDIDTHQYFHTGPEGLLWEMKDGKPTFTAKGLEVINGADMPMEGGGTLPQARAMFNTLGQTDGTINPHTGDTLGYWSWKSYLTMNPTLVKKQLAEFYGNGSYILQDYLEAHNMIAHSTQAVNMVPNVSKELSLTANSIKELLDTYAWKIVLAKDQAEFDSLWAEMVEKANGLGMQQVVDFYNTAWANALKEADEYK